MEVRVVGNGCLVGDFLCDSFFVHLRIDRERKVHFLFLKLIYFCIFREVFDFLSSTFEHYTALTYQTLSWLLGFYIGEIVKRWWTQFELIVCPDEFVSRRNDVLITF
jgi:hypothetical protein